MGRRSLSSAGNGTAAPIKMSASRVTTILGCQLKARRRYIEKRPEKPSIPMWRGNRMHEALDRWHDPDGGLTRTPAGWVAERWRIEAPAIPQWGALFAAYLELRGEMAPAMTQLAELAAEIKADAVAGRRKGGGTAPKMTNDYRRAEADLLKPWADTLDSLRAQERMLIDDPDGPWETTSRSGFDEYEASLETAAGYEAWWRALGDQQPEILHREKWFSVILEGFELRGQIDRIDLDPVLDAVVVTDYKTGRADGKFERWVQAAFYAIGAEALAGARPAYVRFINLDDGPSVHTYPVRAGWDFELIAQCRQADALLNGPSTPSFNGCGWCAFQRDCFGPDGLMQFRPLEDSDLDDSTVTEVPAS